MEEIYYVNNKGKIFITSSNIRLKIGRIAGNYYLVEQVKRGEKVNTKTLIEGRKNLVYLINSLKLDEHFITFDDNISNFDKSSILKQPY